MLTFPKSPGVYMILNKINGRVYIGSSVNVANRQRSHWRALNEGKHGNSFLQSDWSKCGGSDAFDFIVLVEIQNKETAVLVEQTYIDKYYDSQSQCYNICPKAESCLGVKRTEAQKEHLSHKIKEKGPEYLMSNPVLHAGPHHPNRGKPRTEDVKQRIRDTQATSKPVVQLTKEGVLVAEYPSIIGASRATDIAHCLIQKSIKLGRNAGGFRWKLK